VLVLVCFVICVEQAASAGQHTLVLLYKKAGAMRHEGVHRLF
jgi:hypothetical protein